MKETTGGGYSDFISESWKYFDRVGPMKATDIDWGLDDPSVDEWGLPV